MAKIKVDRGKFIEQVEKRKKELEAEIKDHERELLAAQKQYLKKVKEKAKEAAEYYSSLGKFFNDLAKTKGDITLEQANDIYEGVGKVHRTFYPNAHHEDYSAASSAVTRAAGMAYSIEQILYKNSSVLGYYHANPQEKAMQRLNNARGELRMLDRFAVLAELSAEDYMRVDEHELSGVILIG